MDLVVQSILTFRMLLSITGRIVFWGTQIVEVSSESARPDFEAS
jgi:hypothetical protein